MKPKNSTNSERREFCALTGSAIASLMFGSACRAIGSASDSRLTARVLSAVKTTHSGRTSLDLGGARNPILEVPTKASGSTVPLLVFLHGAGQSAELMFEYLGSIPQEARVAVLAPNSNDYTWDAINGAFGSDVQSLNKALEHVFKNVSVDSSRIALGGFSDGAAYALSLGLINGDLFSRIVAFSPGFVVEGSASGKPELFISHGTSDNILPIDSCSRRIVASLKGRGYQVMFREFNGGHEVPDGVAREALSWVAR